jgi:exonuclease SbcC
MLNKLTYHLKFSNTGQTFAKEIVFQPGLTIISGANETGKSLILEMIEYAWFGTAALRGKLEDYEVLEVDLEWNGYKVSRHGTVHSLDKTKAVGALAVNKAIIEILGIDLDVFRITCSAKQGELDKLTARMRPTERRKMVDEVIGLTKLEEVERECRSESNANKRLRDDLVKRTVEPIEPELPDPYIPSSELEIQFKVVAEIEQLKKIERPKLPPEPLKEEFDDGVESYEVLRRERSAEREGLERTLRSIPRVEYPRYDIEYAKVYYAQEARGPRPSWPDSRLQQWREDWAKMERLAQSVDCPACGTKFVPGEGHAAEVVEAPPISLKEIEQELKRHTRWEDFQGEVLTDRPKITFEELQSQELALSQADVRKSIEDRLAEIPPMESKEDQLKAKLRFEKATEIYSLHLDQYMEKLVKWIEASERISELPVPDPDLEKNLSTMRLYEEQKRRYDADVVDFEAAQKELEDLNLQAEAFTIGADCLKFVRTQVKQHLVPSLNKVASHLLSEMTDGRRKKIVVDEDFEVMVDNQPVRTLSGSGVSVVNLALRIALGQVLTQRVVPIFLADEIDHDMDADRAKATHDAIRALTSTLEQIIVVSHKQVDGDQTIGA